ncbi:cytochrome P450 oxidoreductase [Exophiala aquamarina CBS 119918]|uniref:Cytochrome P450 oxidoreductase n=1 Tax=Exophiala aquamarina CBS 119918 TaxID=1182545 RepID=A0A072PFM9_9EURO|nr:cytochrome P450 oxidoreductase [Exophiala aquamarina CBS 119918]KEF54335.1 cytochrome P450 oxidoreductase [Exophiala aquamarina CBS 119918]
MPLTELVPKTPVSVWALVFSLGLVVYLGQIRLRPGLRKLPGPVVASLTNWWRLYDVSKGSHQETLINLHRKYASDLVRIGPNAVSVADLEAGKIIYGLNKGFTKSSFYHVQQNVSQGKPLLNIFNTTDEHFHTAIKRPVAHSYSMTSLKQYETFVDTTSQLFCRKLVQNYAEPREVCDLGTWLQYYAFDVIGEITFSKRLGFLETGTDIEGIIADIEWRLGYFAVVGYANLELSMVTDEEHPDWPDAVIGPLSAQEPISDAHHP